MKFLRVKFKNQQDRDIWEEFRIDNQEVNTIAEVELYEKKEEKTLDCIKSTHT